ncbi:hypothetical protein PanWU01x14_231010, partial [Parasponia andersonii]
QEAMLFDLRIDQLENVPGTSANLTDQNSKQLKAELSVLINFLQLEDLPDVQPS